MSEPTLMQNGRTCPYCRKPVMRQRHPGGRLERLAQFMQRVYCNQACKVAWGRQIKGLPVQPEAIAQ